MSRGERGASDIEALARCLRELDCVGVGESERSARASWERMSAVLHDAYRERARDLVSRYRRRTERRLSADMADGEPTDG